VYVISFGELGKPGSYSVPVGTNRAEAIALGKEWAQQGERFIRDNVALLKEWKPDGFVQVHELPAGSPVVSSVVGPQFDPILNIAYGGGSLQWITSSTAVRNMRFVWASTVAP
jgi:hypothetical protein